MYVVSTVVPFASFAWTLAATTSPEYDLSVGVNVTTPVSLSTVYVPITFPSGDLASTDAAGCPFSSNKVIVSLLIGATGSPSVNVTVPVCTIPCGATDSAGVALGVTGVTVGVYVADAFVPFISSRTTVTAGALPTKLGSGVNVTVPSAATVYVPTPSTFLVVDPSSNVAGTASFIGTSGFPAVNVGAPVCTCPCFPVVSAGSAVGVTGVTVGVYLAVTSVPFLSTRLTVTPVPSPVNDFSGTNVTVPSGATVYVPSPGIVLVVDPSSNVAGVSSSISTVFSTPSTVALPPSNVGLPFCVLP